ncbi:ABC transporter permease [Nocardia wallacei]|uniref:ABC transporter permease n=1 Tax=Nocardia wallacei TaxID=480035 RepID=UPI002453970C|nr:ABC transporter permease [Nocardia wallacei]
MNAEGIATHIRRGIAAEWTRTSGRSFLWTAAVPLTYGLPLLVTFGIAAVAERFATIPGQLQVTSSTTTNSVYWVITLSVSIMMVTAAYAHATQWRGRTGDLNAFLFPRTWTAALARWIYYGLLAAASTVVLLVLVMLLLPRLFPHVYGTVNITDPAGLRFLWAVPIYAFAACGIGIAVGSLIRTPSAAVAALLFWVYVAENSISLLPNGYVLQAYAPFLNAVSATGQEMAFLPRFGRTGSLIYFLVVTAALFTATALLPALAARRRTMTTATHPTRRHMTNRNHPVGLSTPTSTPAGRTHF